MIFDDAGAGSHASERETCTLTASELSVLAALQQGLPICQRPYQEIGRALDLSEADVIAIVQRLAQTGPIKRLGLVVRHHELGIQANAMVVWQVPPARVDAIGQALAAEQRVNLCYRRTPRPPVWPYNLYCMLHGSDRQEVEAEIEAICNRHRLNDIPRALLFSTARLKQCGGRYVR